jgi:hypothetical protein
MEQVHQKRNLAQVVEWKPTGNTRVRPKHYEEEKKTTTHHDPMKISLMDSTPT